MKKGSADMLISGNMRKEIRDKSANNLRSKQGMKIGMPGAGASPFRGIDPALKKQGMGGAGGAGGFGGAPVYNRPLAEKWATELTQLKEMGFTDEATNTKMLQQCNGNVDMAIERIFMNNQRARPQLLANATSA